MTTVTAPLLVLVFAGGAVATWIAGVALSRIFERFDRVRALRVTDLHSALSLGIDASTPVKALPPGSRRLAECMRLLRMDAVLR